MSDLSKKILSNYGLENNELLGAIVESIIQNGGTANYSETIYKYVRNALPYIQKKYNGRYHNFKALVNATVQRYTKDMASFCGLEIFISEDKGSGTYSLIDYR